MQKTSCNYILWFKRYVHFSEKVHFFEKLIRHHQSQITPVVNYFFVSHDLRLRPSDYVRVVFKVVGDITSLFFRKGTQKIHDPKAKKGGNPPKNVQNAISIGICAIFVIRPLTLVYKLRVQTTRTFSDGQSPKRSQVFNSNPKKLFNI